MSIVERIRFIPTVEVIEIDELPQGVAQSLQSRARNPVKKRTLPKNVRGVTYNKSGKLCILFSASKVNQTKASELADKILGYYGLRLQSFSCRGRTIWRMDIRLNMAVTELSLFELLTNQLRHLPGVMHISWIGNKLPLQLFHVSLFVSRKPTPDLEGIIRLILA